MENGAMRRHNSRKTFNCKRRIPAENWKMLGNVFFGNRHGLLAQHKGQKLKEVFSWKALSICVETVWLWESALPGQVGAGKTCMTALARWGWPFRSIRERQARLGHFRRGHWWGIGEDVSWWGGYHRRSQPVDVVLGFPRSNLGSLQKSGRLLTTGFLHSYALNPSTVIHSSWKKGHSPYKDL